MTESSNTKHDNQACRAPSTTVVTKSIKGRPRREVLGRIGFSIAEAARALGVRPEALRRMVERHARAEGDETIARLTGGIVARKRNGLGRWLVVIPADLRG